MYVGVCVGSKEGVAVVLGVGSGIGLQAGRRCGRRRGNRRGQSCGKQRRQRRWGLRRWRCGLGGRPLCGSRRRLCGRERSGHVRGLFFGQSRREHRERAWCR